MNITINKNIILFFTTYALITACVPQVKQDPLTSDTGLTDVTQDRKIASEKAESSFNSLSVEMNTRIGDREYIQNVFVNIFGPTADTIVKPFIYNSSSSLNGGCSQYEGVYPDIAAATGGLTITDPKADCNLAVMNMPVTGGENSIREGLRIQACEKVVSDANSLFYLIDSVTGTTNAQGSFATVPTKVHVTEMYNRFYPTKTIPVPVLDSLYAIATSTTVPLAKDKFKMIALTVCMSADWQIP